MDQQSPVSRGNRKERIGFVISHKMHKTIVVKVERRVRHPLYGKEMRMASKMYVHDEKDEAKVGDKSEGHLFDDRGDLVRGLRRMMREPDAARASAGDLWKDMGRFSWDVVGPLFRELMERMAREG